MIDRSEAMEKEFNKAPGGNYFTFVNEPELTRLGITQWKPIIGDNMIRIVFPPDRPGYYGKEIYKHNNVGVNRKTILCKKHMFNERCPICEYADSLKKDDPNDKRAGELYAQRRYLFFVVDVSSNEAMAKGIRWFDCPVGVYKEIKSRSKNKRGRGGEDANFKKYIDVSHPVEGRDICFTQTKVSGKYGYEGVELVASEPVPENWYKDLPEFDDVLKVTDIEEIEEALSGEGTKTDTTEQTDKQEEEEEQEIEREVSRPAEQETEVEEETVQTETTPEKVVVPENTRGATGQSAGTTNAAAITTRGAATTKGTTTTQPATNAPGEMSARDKIRARLAVAKKAQAGG
jgi:hypothetical protein